MPESPKDTPDDPQVRRIKHLVRLMQRFDLTAIDLDDKDSVIRLRRRVAGAEPAPVAYAPAAAAPVAAAPAPVAAAPATPAVPTAPVGVFIESPMVGTFYASPTPDAPVFVSVGSSIRQDSTVCIIEAMKVFTDIPAGISGKIVEILAKNGQPVEFGQPLFRVEPS